MRSWPDWQWQYSRAVRSRAPCRGKIPPRCVPGRQSVASFALHASRKWPRAGKSPVRGKIRAPCIRKRAGFGKMCAPCIRNARKPPSEDTPREYLARKGSFSLHGPLESCTARRSCHPASANHPSARNPCAADQHGTARAARNHAAVRMAAHHPRHSRCQRQPHRKRSHTPPPHDTEASGGHEILRRPSVRSAKAQLGGQRHRSTPRRHLASTSTTAVAPPGSMRTLTPQAPPHPRRPPLAVPTAQTLAAPRANQQQPSAELRFIPSKARTHHTYLSAAPVTGFSS